MASPIPLLAIAAAAFFLMRKKEARDNVFVVSADPTTALPILLPPYVQVSSSYAGITSKDIEDAVRPIAAANPTMGFVIAAGPGANRLSMAKLGVEMAPDVFTVTSQVTQEVGPTTKGMGGPDATLTALQGLVNEAVAFIKAPHSG